MRACICCVCCLQVKEFFYLVWKAQFDELGIILKRYSKAKAAAKAKGDGAAVSYGFRWVKVGGGYKEVETGDGSESEGSASRGEQERRREADRKMHRYAQVLWASSFRAVFCVVMRGSEGGRGVVCCVSAHRCPPTQPCGTLQLQLRLRLQLELQLHCVRSIACSTPGRYIKPRVEAKRQRLREILSRDFSRQYREEHKRGEQGYIIRFEGLLGRLRRVHEWEQFVPIAEGMAGQQPLNRRPGTAPGPSSRYENELQNTIAHAERRRVKKREKEAKQVSALTTSRVDLNFGGGF